MAINFPSNPNNGDTLDVGQTTYTFNSTSGVWDIDAPSAGASTTVYADMTALIAATGMSNGDQAFVTGNNNLYIYSGSGWYKVATVQNDSPSAITGVASSYELTTDATPTVITAVSTDPEGFPLTWSYSTSGLGSIATVSQSDNVFTITPSTTVSDAGTFSLTINATDGVNGAVSTTTNLTLEFIFNITNSRYTTLLATATGTSDNRTITDASTSNHTITGASNGDIYNGTFSPYRHGGYSAYMVHTDDLTVASDADFNFGSGDFTIEYWIWPNGTPNNPVGMPDMRPPSTDGPYIQININTSNQVGLYANSAQRISQSSSTALTSNAWNHVCLTRSGSTTTLYIGGASVGSWSDSTTYSQGRCLIAGHSYHANRGWASGCYISDFRIVKGTAITPASGGPTERLTAVTNTSLLTCHLPYIADGSSNGHLITVNGNTSTKPFGPFDYEEYSESTNGGSLYVDATRLAGNGHSCNIADHDDFNLTSDFTIKFWAYHSYFAAWNTNPAYTYFSNYTYNTGGIRLSVMGQYSGKLVLHWMNGGSGGNIQFNFYPQVGQWYYYELTRSSNTLTVKANGTSVGTLDVTNMANPSTNLAIGSSFNPSNGFGENYIDGYISDFQYITGGTSEESSVPTAPMTTDTNSKLHIKGTDASIIDKSQGNNLQLTGNTTGSTTQVKFTDTKSVYFDGTGDGIVVPHNDNLNLNGSDWTIEFWYNVTNPNAIRNWNFISKGDNSTVRPYAINFRLDNSNGVEPRLFVSSNNSSQVGISNNAWQAFGNWHHVAFVRVNSTGVITRYINGTENGTVTSDLATNTEDLEIGYVASGSDEEGYMQDLRITKGLARYTANFTPPTESLKG